MVYKPDAYKTIQYLPFLLLSGSGAGSGSRFSDCCFTVKIKYFSNYCMKQYIQKTAFLIIEYIRLYF